MIAPQQATLSSDLRYKWHSSDQVNPISTAVGSDEVESGSDLREDSS